MLTLEDCIDICGLTREEIRYFMEHEHISDFRTAELAERYVVVDDSGTPHLQRAILADIDDLKRRHKRQEARCLEAFIRDFVLSHPRLNRSRPAVEACGEPVRGARPTGADPRSSRRSPSVPPSRS